MNKNPFGVSNPEQVDADYIARNFVDIYTDLPAVLGRCNAFIHGARGTGKSMLLRSLEPEVMIKAGKAKHILDVPYFAVHVPLKKAEFAVPELSRLAGYASTVIGEHLLVMHAMYRAARQIQVLANEIPTESATRFWSRFNELLAICSGKLPEQADISNLSDSQKIFNHIVTICEHEIMKVRQYYVRLPFETELRPYDGPLTSFLDFLLPNAEEIKKMDGIPKVPVFLMLDDADNLPIDMQRILNSWVSTRSTHAVCLKISTQLGYSTFRTIDNRIIESPHDFTEVNLGTIYTNDQERFSKRMRQIVEKRLSNTNINSTPEQFFPIHEKQGNRLDQIKNEIKADWEKAREDSSSKRQGPARVSDDITRLTVPRYMQELAGASKSSHTFSYAGFRSLVDLSGGVVRWFLEPASRMFDRMAETGKPVTTIPVRIQDEIINAWSTEFFNRLTHHINNQVKTDLSNGHEGELGASLHAQGHETVLYEQLKNLIEGLGRLFRHRLLSPDASERRVFSIFISGTIPDELKKVLGLGVRMGYFQTSDNAAKEATGGRLPRFILARRLGPYFKLDISGYAAHLSVKGEVLAISLQNPDAFFKKRTLRESNENPAQLTFNLDWAEKNVDDDEC
ncbi:MAG: hypothetical protein HQL67_11570 [Magnetococcales bacterium]|nr:hypothetical protein [Magnetococcales bacterium]